MGSRRIMAHFEWGTRFESKIPDPCDLSQAVFCIKCLNFVLKGKLHPVHFVMSSMKAVFGRFLNEKYSTCIDRR